LTNKARQFKSQSSGTPQQKAAGVIHTTKIKKRNRDFQKNFGKSLKKVWKYENNPLTFEP